MDDVVVVGGFVPSLLIDQESLPDQVEAHVGTLDLDLGLSVALSHEAQTRMVAEKLRNADFEADLRPENGARQTWKWKHNTSMTVDVLAPPTPESSAARKIHDWSDLSAFVTPGLELAFEDRELVTVRGQTLLGRPAEARMNVCGPGAFIVLKAQAMKRRADNKDAYDIYYLLRNYPGGVEEVARRFVPLLYDGSAREALDYLRQDFGTWDAIGAERVAMFLSQDIESDVRGEAFVVAKEFLKMVEQLRGAGE